MFIGGITNSAYHSDILNANYGKPEILNTNYGKPEMLNTNYGKPNFSSVLYSTRFVENELDNDEITSLVESELEKFYFGSENINKNYIHNIISDKTFDMLKRKLQLGISFKIIEDTIILADMHVSDNVDFKECYLDLTSTGKLAYNDCVTIYGSEISNMLLLFPNSIAYLSLALKLFGIKNENCTELDLCATHIEEFEPKDDTSRIKLNGGKNIVRMNLGKIFMIMLTFIVIVLIVVLVVVFIVKPLINNFTIKTNI